MKSIRIRHIISTKQFLDRGLVEEVFRMAERMERGMRVGTIRPTLRGKILACVFYEPSTRTRFSFESAMLRLGGSVIATENAGQFSSVTKGETLEDTIRIIGGYCDGIVLRHSEEGAADRAARVSPVPLINAGDGTGEHPTQALLDLYTIKKEIGRMDDFTIACAGDLRYGRTIHSLIHLLSLGRRIKVLLVSPKELAIPGIYRAFMDEQGIAYSETDDLDAVVPEIDVLYMTRIQKERFRSQRMYERVKDFFSVDARILNELPRHAVIMHPLPRVQEIASAVDADPRAAYFRQAKNGLYIRMALLHILVGRR